MEFLGNAELGKSSLLCPGPHAVGSFQIWSLGEPQGALGTPQLGVVASKSQPIDTGLSPSVPGKSPVKLPQHPQPWSQDHVKPKNTPTIPVSLHLHTPGLFFLEV